MLKRAYKMIGQSNHYGPLGTNETKCIETFDRKKVLTDSTCDKKSFVY